MKENKNKVVYHSLDIFEEILMSPFTQFSKFIVLMTALVGSKNHKYELRVFNLLK